MKFDMIALAVTGAACVAAVTGCTWLLSGFAPGFSAAAVFLEADIIVKLVMILLMLLTLPILVLGGIGLATRSAARPMGMSLRIIALVCVLLGGLAAGYSWMNIQSAIAVVGPVSFEVVAPSYAEALMAFACGLFVATLALAFAVGAGLRAGARPKA
ncbi:hypothetical protein GGQ87_000779 [Brevundimonas alba]|uniref:Uncharacterized protein n=1 Tax=Brevundimonas alba TaxID=74314 RepID=A0A7X6BNJ3_9CAUL|nr:hypothetical protein [Brevundimonas alba]NJC40521.1 hypothetical protein [Brevundimonas alba]